MKMRPLLCVGLLLLLTAGCGGGSAFSTAPDSIGTQDARIKGAFGVCADGIHVGQSAPVAEVTCTDVCRVLGFAGCEYRAGQAGLVACTPVDPSRSGACNDAFKEGWSSQCRCKR